jgi:hypothetical protein
LWDSAAATRAVEFGFTALLLDDAFGVEADGHLEDDASFAATVLNASVCKVTIWKVSFSNGTFTWVSTGPSMLSAGEQFTSMSQGRYSESNRI